MAGRYSNNDNCEVKFYKDIQASTLAVDCVGTWALLAGRKSLAFVDLRDTEKLPVKVTRQSKWDIGCVQWNRHAYHAHRFVTACNQRLDVFDFRESSAAHLSSLKAHSRTVSDVDWSPFDVNIVASCSVDTFTYLWDVRDPKKPVKFFQTVSGAYQVKWNKVSNNLFATTHDGDVRIWDPRKGNSPLEYISAHPSKIHGLDWSHTDQYKLVTASQDCTIRFWDYRNPRRSETMINSWNPVWRARYTPFGSGIMSVVVPQIRRGENSLYLWNQDNQQSHVHTFVGHQDVILEFQWRKQEEGMLDHQLVTWSKDQSLRIWRVDPTVQKLCGHETDDFAFPTIDDLTLQKSSSSSHHKLERLSSLTETTSIHSSTDHTTLDSQGSVMVSGPQGPSVLGPPSHSSSSSLSNGLDDILPRPLNGAIQGEKNEDRLSMLEKKYKVEKVKPPPTHTLSHSSPSSQLVPMYPDGRYEDNSVPFPRTCGASFCSNDCLVIFCAPPFLKKVDQESDITPRSLSDLVRVTAPSHQWMRAQHAPSSRFAAIFGSPPPGAPSEGVSISDFFTEKQAHHHHHHHRKYSNHKSSHGRSRDATDGKKDREGEMTDRAKKRLQKVARVQVYNISAINPVNLYLAKNYKLDLVDVRGCCEHNAKVASKAGRKDLVQMWTVVCHISEAERKSSDMDEVQQPYAMRPFGRPLVEKYLKHFERQRDVQTMAMIACMFWDRETRPRDALSRLPTTSANFSRPDSRLSFEGVNPYKTYDTYNPYHTVSSMTNLLKGWTSSASKYAENVSRPNHTTPTSTVTASRRAIAAASTAYPKVLTNPNHHHHHHYQPSPHHPYQLGKGLTNPAAAATTAAYLNSIATSFYSPQPIIPTASVPPTFPSPLPPPPPPPPLPPPQPFRGMATKVKGRALAEVASESNLSALFKAVMNKGKRSRSLSESFEDFNGLDKDLVESSDDRDMLDSDIDHEKIVHINNCKILNPDLKGQYEQIKRSYANILYKWGLLNQRTQILKHTVSIQASKKVEFSIPCSNCSDTVMSVQCNRCRYPSINCSICHIGVRGPANVCLACGHGGHSSHMMTWFHNNSQCPSGCGCNCLQEAPL